MMIASMAEVRIEGRGEKSMLHDIDSCITVPNIRLETPAEFRGGVVWVVWVGPCCDMIILNMQRSARVQWPHRFNDFPLLAKTNEVRSRVNRNACLLWSCRIAGENGLQQTFLLSLALHLLPTPGI